MLEITDLSNCQNIRLVYNLYNHIETPYCFAPILPILPNSSEHTADVTPEDHLCAQLFKIIQNNNDKDIIQPYNIESVLEVHQICRFLEKCGTVFNYKNFLCILI